MSVLKTSTLFFSLLLVISFALSGCTQQSISEAEVTTIGYGLVNEVTMINTIESSGSITPKQVATVSWSASGTIESVAVQVGQKVQTKDILMTLDPNSVPDNLKLSLLKLSEMTSPVAIAEAQQAVLDAQSALDDAQYSRKWLDYVDDDVIANAYAEYILAKDSYDAAKEVYDNLADELAEDDPVLAAAYTSMYTAKSAMDSKEYVYDLYNSESSAQTYAEYDNAVVLAQNKLTEAQNYLTALTGGEVPAGATGTDLMNYYEIKMNADSLNLRAPIAGTVAAIYDQAGFVVSNNRASVEVVDRSKLYVTISLDENDILSVCTGMRATVTIEVLPDLELSGLVQRIEPVGQVSNGVVYYDVVVELDQTNDTIPINATASVTIQIGEPQVNLVVPATAIQSDTTGEYVQVITAAGTQRVEVISGEILSDDTVVVIGDLKAGDQVLLTLQASSSSDSFIQGGGGLLNGGGQGPSGGGAVSNGGDNGQP